MGTLLNALDVEELRKEVAELKANPEKCRIVRNVKAEWIGGTRARVHVGDQRQLFVGGEGDFGAMTVALGSLLACEVDVIATHATLRGIELEKLEIEGTGQFNYGRYMGAAEEPDPGYQQVEYVVRIKAKNASREQIQELVKLCETASPVGDTYARSVPMTFKSIIE